MIQKCARIVFISLSFAVFLLFTLVSIGAVISLLTIIIDFARSPKDSLAGEAAVATIAASAAIIISGLVTSGMALLGFLVFKSQMRKLKASG